MLPLINTSLAILTSSFVLTHTPLVQAQTLPDTPPISPPDVCLADINQDGIVDITDFSLLAQNFLKSNPELIRADIDSNGVVDLSDFSKITAHFFKTRQS